MPSPSVTEAWTGSALTLALDDGGWQAIRVFHAAGFASKLAAIAACATLSSPAGVGLAHPDNSRLICQTMNADDGLVLRKIIGTYTIPTLGQFDPDPLHARPRYRWKPGVRMERSDIDYYGNPKLNSAGVPFDPPSQIPRGLLFLTVLRNEPFYDVQRSVSIQCTTNSAAITVPGAGVVQPGQMFCHCMECAQDVYQGIPYVTVLYNFELRRGNLITGGSEYDGFFDSQLDQGDSGWSGSPATRGLICNADGVESGYVLLDGTGKPKDSALRILSGRDGTVQSAVVNPNTFPPSNVKVITSDGGGGGIVAKRILYRDFAPYDYNVLSLF